MTVILIFLLLRNKIENILVKETYQGALKNYSCLLIGKQLNILFMRKENNYASNA